MAAQPELYPQRVWDHVAAPDALGWSSHHLQQAQAYARAIGSVAVAVVTQGQLLAGWGEIARPFNLRSIRKSLLSSLYGIAIEDGQIRVAATLGELGINDTAPSLTVAEQRATIADLLTSRSGVYHPSNHQAARERDGLPPRGAHAPGTHWYYNNWDFNALGTIFEQCTQQRIFDAFEQQIARPVQMEDFDRSAMDMCDGPYSMHPSYFFRLSARDLARFGLLYLRHGRWRAHQIVPRAWVEASTTAQVLVGAGPGYGYMWWIAVNGKLLDPSITVPDGAFAALGTGGQFLLIIPAMDLVVAHVCDPDGMGNGGDAPTPAQMSHLVQLIVDARVPA